MNITGSMLIGGKAVRSEQETFTGFDRVSGEPLAPDYTPAGPQHIDEAVALAGEAFPVFRRLSPVARADFLNCCADEILALGDALVERAVAESGLPLGRISGERDRTVNQLRLFAAVLREGSYLDVRIDEALPDRPGMPRPDLRSQQIGLGPVAVFGASNFPLAFSVAGGDTASALAAGCPVVVKAHPAHPGTSEMVALALCAAVRKCELPVGVFSLLFDSGIAVGQSLVSHPGIRAVGFTGSFAAGMALKKIADQREQPIPVYAEMGSVNPVFLFPEALQARGEELARGFAASVTLGAGQFCTNPGLAFAVRSPALESFVATLAEAIAEVPAQTMLTSAIQGTYASAAAELEASDGVECVAAGLTDATGSAAEARLLTTTAARFLADRVLSHEIFGPCSLLVVCESEQDFLRLAQEMEGQLTVTLQLDDGDLPLAARLLPVLEDKAGRILCNGFPTGVEVCHAMVHGGPFPASSDGASTSVGSMAIRRFLRPVCYQNFPPELLPEALQGENPYEVERLINGEQTPG
ncbi:aldehyde dehydrogenase (NADP(+)) [Parahaliea maris]|uniref:Aldehyde dehydrogenase (NADP(+)) n=1 Tax=Parahaliea maris TaxID=2716870 RepID=A0A5C8ZRW3_9GAMM|nr:aldehyde dehydrogenase (NADP(+)) [Parahaliea maris]TXS90247.1 aldehyde dehydrogenase (NADP(+)) [Parahaliea maris]